MTQSLLTTSQLHATLARAYEYRCIHAGYLHTGEEWATSQDPDLLADVQRMVIDGFAGIEWRWAS